MKGRLCDLRRTEFSHLLSILFRVEIREHPTVDACRTGQVDCLDGIIGFILDIHLIASKITYACRSASRGSIRDRPRSGIGGSDFDKQLYLGKLFAIPLEVELDTARKSGNPGANKSTIALALHGVSEKTCKEWCICIIGCEMNCFPK